MNGDTAQTLQGMPPQSDYEVMAGRPAEAAYEMTPEQPLPQGDYELMPRQSVDAGLDLDHANQTLTTFYYPETPEATEAAGLSPRMEGGIYGAGEFSDMDLRNHTLEKFQNGESPFVAVAMRGQPTGKMFTMNVGDQTVIAKNVDTGGGLHRGQIDVATSDPQKAKTGIARQEPLNAMQAAIFTGKDPGQITAEDMNGIVNRYIDNYPRIAGDVTAESIEAAQAGDGGLPELHPAQEPSAMEIAQSGFADSGGGEEITASPGGGGSVISGSEGAMFVPERGNAHFDGEDKKTGTLSYNGGEIKYHPSTDTLEWTVGGKRFYQTGDLGKVTGVNPNIKRDPVTGEWYDFTDPSHVTKVQVEGHAPPYMPSLSPAQNLDRLRQLSPHDANSVDLFSKYLLPMVTQRGTINPEFERLQDYIYSKIRAETGQPIDPTTYLLRRQTEMQYGDQGTGKPGFRLTGANQAILHGATLFDLLHGLPEHDFTSGNTVENIVKTKFGNPGVTKYNTMLRLFATELFKASKGGAPNEGEVNDIVKEVPASGSKAQLEGAIKDVMFKYLDGAMIALDGGYKRQMGVNYPKLLDEESQRVLTDKNGLNFSEFGGRQLRRAAGGGDAEDFQTAKNALISQGRASDDATVRQAVQQMRQRRAAARPATPGGYEEVR